MKIFFLITLFFSFNTFAKTESAYTSILMDDCVIVESSNDYPDADIDFLISECASYGGYKLMVNGGDLRYSVELSYRGKMIPTPNIQAFHDLGADKAEWRFEVAGKNYDKKVTYTALIYRLSFQDFDPKTQKDFENEMLVVVRLNGAKSCVLGTIAKQAKMNELARTLADNKSAACK